MKRGCRVENVSYRVPTEDDVPSSDDEDSPPKRKRPPAKPKG